MMRFTLCAALLLFLALGAPAAEGAPIKVACVGDSITQISGWPDKLGAKLGAGYSSTNYGLSGTTALKNSDHTYWGSQQYNDSHAANPDIVVIMLGTNDSKPFNWDAHKGEFVGDYEALIDTYATLPSHPKIYLNLCPPAGTNGYQIVGSVIENEIIPDIKQIAAAKGLPTIDVFDAFGGHNLDQSLFGGPGDLVHPNAKGAQVIADTVYAALTAPASDGGAGAGGATDAGTGGAKSDAASDAGATGGAGRGAGGAVGTGGASGAAGAAAGSTGAATGAGGATAGAGGGATAGAGGGATAGASGATPSGAAGSPASAGAAGTGGRPPHASSGGCAVAPSTGDFARLSLVVFGLASLAARRRARRRRAGLCCTSR
jgi:lysophospholipase L1-like esterase